MRSTPKSKHIVTASVIILALALALGLYAFRGLYDDREPSEPAPEPSEQAGTVYQHPLTGERTDGPVELPQVYGVMIDNSIDAWPQVGADEAFLVIEAPVESGITRFLAFFQEGRGVEKIGPVRSARPYFVDWNNELDAMYAHIGGSPQSLDLIETNGTFDLNQFFNGFAYWRSTDRLAPHNAYTSTERLDEAFAIAEENGSAPERLYGRWKFLKNPQEPDETPQDVTIDFSGRSYRVKWEFDSESGAYLRRQSGLPHVTEDGTRFSAENIAIVVTDMKTIDAIGRREIRTIGEGKAWVLRGGRVIEGEWRKPSESERLRFYDTNGNEVRFTPGTTWIEVMHTGEGVIIEPDE